MQKTIFTTVGFSNFQSFGNKMQWVSLDNSPLTLIRGENQDIGDTNESANGVGKTAAFNALIFCLYGEGIDKVRADELVNLSNGKRLVTEVHMKRGSSTAVVRRGRKPSMLEFEVDGVSMTRDSMKNTDEAIVEFVGLSYDVFMLTHFMSPTKRTFFEMSGPEQRTVVEQLLSLDVLAARSEVAKKLTSENKAEIKTLGREIDILSDGCEKARRRLERSMAAVAEFDDEKISRIDRMNAELSRLSSVDFHAIELSFKKRDDISEKIGELEDKIYTAKSEASVKERALRKHSEICSKIEKLLKQESEHGADTQRELDERIAEQKTYRSEEEYHMCIDGIRENNERARVQSLLEERKTARLKVLDRIKDREAQIEAHENGTCHVCGGPYKDESHLSSLKAQIEKDRNKIVDIDDEIYDCEAFLTDSPRDVELPFDGTLKECEDKIRLLNKCNAMIEVLTAKVASNPYTTMVLEAKNELKEFDATHTLDELMSGLDQLEAEISDAEDAISSLKTDLKQIDLGGYAAHQDMVSDKMRLDFQRDNIKKIESEENPHIEVMKSDESASAEVENDLRVKQEELVECETIDTHLGYLVKMLTDSKSFVRRRILDNYVPYINKQINSYTQSLGLPHVCELNSDLSVSIMYMNRDVSYHLMSRGERLRLNIAVTMAFRDTISLLGKGCNIALVDEFLDSALDKSGIRAAAKFIVSCAENVFLITHRDDLTDSATESLTVVKKNGFSTIQ
tara:strand:+ start:5472 stop:7688 length:2217 start_codon:yes stop_codon:yes gene_type:complete